MAEEKKETKTQTKPDAIVKKDAGDKSKDVPVNPVKQKEEFWGKDKSPSIWRKWAKGLLLVIAFSVVTGFLATFSLYKLTAPEPAKATMQKVISVIFTHMASSGSGQNLDVAKLISSIEETTKDIPDLKINLNTEELKKLSPETAIDSIAVQVSEALYEQQKLITLPEKAGQVLPMEFKPDSSRSLQFFNRATHEALGDKLKIIGAVAVVIIALLAMVSLGGSRLSAPGWVILIASLPVFLTLTFSSDIITKIFEQFNTDEFAAQASQVVSDILPSLVEIVRPIYLAGTIFGAVLIVVGILLGLAFRPKPAS